MKEKAELARLSGDVARKAFLSLATGRCQHDALWFRLKGARMAEGETIEIPAEPCYSPAQAVQALQFCSLRLASLAKSSTCYIAG